MSPTDVACPAPARCRALVHRASSRAHDRCARLSASWNPAPKPLPATDAARHPGKASVRAAVEKMLAEQVEDLRAPALVRHARSAWLLSLFAQRALVRAERAARALGSGALGPGRDCAAYSVEVIHDGVQVGYFDAQGRRHRDGGPAVVDYDRRGRAVLAVWVAHGIINRTDGPAALDARTGHAGFALEDDFFSIDLPGDFTDLLAAGADAPGAVSWLAFGREVGDRDLALELAREGREAAGALQCAQAGVVDEQEVRAVLAGELPLSWAIAGR